MTRYRPLFHVDIAHDYFLSRDDVVLEAQADAARTALTALWSASGIFEIFPTESTIDTLAGHKMLYRATESGFLVAVQLDASASDIRPSVPPAVDFRVTFAMRIKDSRLANYTELGPSTSGFFRFSNDSQNRVADTNFLSRRVAAFDASKRYVAGEAFSRPAGGTFDLLVAVRDTGPSAAPLTADWRRIPPDTFSSATTYQRGAIVLFASQVFRALVDNPGTNFGNAAEWQLVSTLGNQYVTVADAILPVSGLYNLDVSGASLSQATIQLFRGNDVIAASEQRFSTSSGVLDRLQVDLRALAPGPYRLEVLDVAGAIVPARTLRIYLSPEAMAGGWFGVGEFTMGTGDFALFNADGTLRSPRYALRFLNRATRWRYIFPAAQSVGAGADVAAEAGNNRILVTASPRPLTRFGAGPRLQADSAATPAISEEILLPAPDVNRIRRENAEWYSETHVRNLLVGP